MPNSCNPRALALLLAGLLAGSAASAPPNVTALAPPGAARGTTVSVTAVGTFDTWPVYVWSSSSEVRIEAEKEKGRFKVTVDPKAVPGLVTFRFHDASGASSLRPFAIGTVPDATETEPNDEPSTAQTVPRPAIVNGTLGKTGDVDCFAVPLRKGQTLVASLDAHRPFRSPIDAVLQLVAPDGSVCRQNHDAHGLDPELAVTAPADGRYVVRLFAFPAQPDSSIRFFGSPASVYRLLLTTGEVIRTATPLAAEQDKAVTLHLTGWNLTERTLRLAPGESRIGAARPMTILREPHPCYDLNATPAAPLEPPFTLTGRIDRPGQTRRWSLAGNTGRPWRIELESETLGLSLTPVLTIHDDQEKQLLRAEPAALHGSIAVDFSPPANGVYHLDVGDLLKTAGPDHLFRLRVTPATPDLEVRLAADRWTIAAGAALDIPITLARKHGLTGEFRIDVDGLPEGIVVEPAKPPEKPDPNKLTLRLKATRAGLSVPLKISVFKQDDPAFRRPARFPDPDFDRQIETLWLTTTPAPEAKTSK